MSYITASNLWRHRWTVTEKYTFVHQSQPTPTSRQQTLVIPRVLRYQFSSLRSFAITFAQKWAVSLCSPFSWKKNGYGWQRGATICAVKPGQLNWTVKPEQKSDKESDLDRDYVRFTQPFESYNLMQYTKANTITNFQRTFWEGWHPFYLFTKKQGQARERVSFRPLQAI